MKASIENLLTQVYELEGLLLVMQRHSDDVPQVVVDRFKEKVQQVTGMAALLQVPEAKVEAPQQPSQPAQQPEPAVTVPVEPATAVRPPVFKGAEPVKKENETPAKSTRQARDLMAAFSINDRFLFQRELFDGDASKLDATIAALQCKRDVDDAHLYLTDELGWDTSNDVVKEFVRLIDLGFKE